jgi:hypothetical protein
VPHPGPGTRISGNIADLVRDAARADPDKPALLFSGGRTTWAELEVRVGVSRPGCGPWASSPVTGSRSSSATPPTSRLPTSACYAPG